jgi:hypothetical protein
MDPGDLVEVACACEARDLIKQEAIMAELRYRNIILVAQSYFHEYEHSEHSLRTADDHLHSVVNNAVHHMSAVVASDVDHEDRQHSGHLKQHSALAPHRRKQTIISLSKQV